MKKTYIRIWIGILIEKWGKWKINYREIKIWEGNKNNTKLIDWNIRRIKGE